MRNATIARGALVSRRYSACPCVGSWQANQSSACLIHVVNLAADKQAVFREIARVLRPGGRIGISDIVASDELTPDQRAERGSYVGCIAGALSFSEFESGLRDAGLIDISLTSTHTVADGMHSVIVKATKPMDAAPSVSMTPSELTQATSDCCGAIGCC